MPDVHLRGLKFLDAFWEDPRFAPLVADLHDASTRAFWQAFFVAAASTENPWYVDNDYASERARAQAALIAVVRWAAKFKAPIKDVSRFMIWAIKGRDVGGGLWEWPVDVFPAPEQVEAILSELDTKNFKTLRAETTYPSIRAPRLIESDDDDD